MSFVLAQAHVHAQSPSILFLGDSHAVGTFGKTLDLKLRENFKEVTTLASCGSIARWWYTAKTTQCGYFFHRSQKSPQTGKRHSTPRIEDELKSLQPQIVLIQLGTNYIPYDNLNYAKKDLQILIHSIKNAGSRCFFVSHPESRKFKGDSQKLSNFLKTFVPKFCEFFDSVPITPYPAKGGDGIHYDTTEGRIVAKKWANAVNQWIQDTIQVSIDK